MSDMNAMNNTLEPHPKSTGGLICGIIGCILGATGYLSIFGFPFCLIAWILGAKAVNRARAMGVGAAGSAITAKVMGILGTIATGIAVLIMVAVMVVVGATAGTNGGWSALHCKGNRIMVESAYATAAMSGEKAGSLEDLVEHGNLPSIPKCPAGGTYILAPNEDGATASCICTKHGARVQAQQQQ